MNRAFLDQYHRIEREHWWFRVRGRLLSDMARTVIPSSSRPEILNVGAATGRSTELLQSFGRVTSLEYDQPCVDYCRDVLKLDVMQGSITELPYAEESFDLVCAFDVVEHVEDDTKAVEELLRVCKPGGLVFMTVPAYMSLWSDHDVVNLHFRRYQKSQLLQLFSQGKLLRATHFNTLLFPMIWLARRLGRLFKRRSSSLKPDNEWLQHPVTDWLFGTIFSLERPLLRNTDLPFGVSLAVIWKKNENHA
jgi:2-polyprenyl-3-methyl-5-hydroxy-6-metoxy-1,4-benzoquinol methylase